MRLPLWLRPSALLSRLPRRRLVAPARTETAVLEKQLELAVPSPAWGWIALAAVLIVAAVAATLWWLLNDPPATPDAVRTALLAGAGVGGALTLMLAFRRQRQQELQSAVTAELTRRGLDSTTHDAAERRVTELYTKAADQLGSDKAAVRLAGLYALERLAQDNPGHQQTVVNVICAYLRMPYALPPRPDPAQERAQTLREAHRRHRALRAAVRAGHASPPAPQADTDTAPWDVAGERQVRLTAQRILADHLRDERTAEQGQESVAPGPRFWAGMRIDLTGAVLIDFDFRNCRPVDTVFEGVSFVGNALFSEAFFAGDSNFMEATFAGGAWFGGSNFTESVVFDKATFAGGAWFGGVTFAGGIRFIGASFAWGAVFQGVTFAGGAWFIGATFDGPVEFDEAVVTAPAIGHSWPEGWRLVVSPDGTGCLRGVEEPALSTADPDDPAEPAESGETT